MTLYLLIATYAAFAVTLLIPYHAVRKWIYMLVLIVILMWVSKIQEMS